MEIYCLNDPEESAKYSDLINDSSKTWTLMSEHWDQFGNYRIAILICEEVS